MFRVHDREKGLNRHLGVVTGLFLLGLSVAIALAVKQQKIASKEVTLGDRVEIEGLGLSVRIPEGWRQKRIGADNAPVGVAYEGGSGVREQYRVSILRMSGSEGPARSLARNLLQVAYHGLAEKDHLVEWTKLGPLAAVQLSLPQLACRAATGPEGKLYALSLATTEPAEGQAKRVLDKIANSAEWSEPALESSIDSIASRVGMRFEVRSPAVFTRGQDEWPGRIQVVAGAGSEATWWLDAWRTPLLAGRTAADLMEDIIPKKGGKGSSEMIHANEGREVLRYRFEVNGRLIEHWVIGLGEHEAVVVQFQTDSGEQALADEIREKVSTTSTVFRSAEQVDVSQATELGRKHVKELHSRGVSYWWGEEDAKKWYVGWKSGQPMIWITEFRRLLGGQVYEISQVYQTQATRRLVTEEELRWRIDRQGRGVNAPPEVPAGYVGAGASDIALFLVARSGPGQDVILFNSRSREPTRWHGVFARGLPPIRGEGTTELEYRVWFREDYSTSPRILVFDGSGQLIREEQGSLKFKLSSEEEVKRSLTFGRLPVRVRR